MEKIKEHIWESILSDIESSQDEKFKDKFKVFKTHEELKQYLEFFLNYSFDDMKRIRSVNYYLQKQKYHMQERRLLGNKTKALPDNIFLELLEVVEQEKGEKIKLALEFEGIEGARGEDTVRIKLNDLDFTHHIVRILNRKRDRWYEIPLNPELEEELKEFIFNNMNNIASHHNYVFFSSNPVQKRDFISQKYLKTLVYDVLKRLGLNKIYTKSIDGRNLNLYSLHSLRGHAGTRVYEKTNHDLSKVQELLDHEPNSADTTLLYIERNIEKDLKGVV